MPSRRQFLQSAAVVSAAPLAARVVFANGSIEPAHFSVIHDARHSESGGFGSRARDLGAEVHAIHGDITDLWQRSLRVGWRKAVRITAGLTERPALFLLERLAWEHGLRVIYQGEHELGGPAPVHRVVRASDTGLERRLAAAGPLWPAALAEQLLAAPREVAAANFMPTDAAMAGRLGEPEMLYSWIIAPRAAAELII